MNSQIVTVNLVPNIGAPAVVRVSQGDIGRPLTFRIMDGTSPAVLNGTTATIEGTKPSGLGFSETGTVNGNSVIINTTLTMTQEGGLIPAEIRLSRSGEDIGTANFILAVERTPHADGTTNGTQESMGNLESRLQSQINDLSDRIDDIEAGQGGGLSQTEKNLILTLFSKAAYAESDAETAYDALESMWATSMKTITYNLSNVVSSNTATSIESGQPYSTALAVRQNYTLNTVTVKMAGVDVTASTYSSGTITIPNVTGNIVITATATEEESDTYLYNWDFTNSLTDSVQSKVATLTHTSVGSTDPERTSAGIVFDEANEICYLGDFGSGYFVGKTIEIDVASFSASLGADSQHYRLVMTPPTTTKGTGPLIYEKSTGWSAYSGSSWSSVYGSAVSGTDTSVLNFFNGKTIKLVFDSSGYCTLYVNGTQIGTSTVTFTGTNAQYLYLGGISGGASYCYDMTISGLRIYENA